jgi:uncharacterized protein YgbK (DUF1537 family)
MVFKRWLIRYGSTLLATLALASVCSLLLWNQHRQAQLLAQSSVRNAARLLADQTQRSFDEVGALLASVGRRYVDATEAGPAALEQLKVQVRDEVPHYALVKRIDRKSVV